MPSWSEKSLHGGAFGGDLKLAGNRSTDRKRWGRPRGPFPHNKILWGKVGGWVFDLGTLIQQDPQEKKV